MCSKSPFPKTTLQKFSVVIHIKVSWEFRTFDLKLLESLFLGSKIKTFKYNVYQKISENIYSNVTGRYVGRGGGLAMWCIKTI